MAERSTGTVKWYNSNKGFGFITPDDGGEDLFFHRSTTARDGPQVFLEGEPVHFIVEHRDDGRIVAVDANTPSFTFSPGVECYCCGGRGHIRRNCPDQPRKPFRSCGWGCACYECGEDGHNAKDCPVGRSVKQTKTVLVEEAALSSEEEDEREPWEIKEREKEYKLRFDMPGMIRNDVKVWVEDKKVVFKAEKALKTKKAGGVKVEDEEDWPAKSYGKYSNRITFPEDVMFEEIKAEVRDGVLYLTVPKAGSKILNINVL